MKRIDLGQLIQILANVGVIAGIAFLAFELRQNTIASRAAAYQGLGIATAETWFSFAHDRELTEALWAVDLGGVEAYRNMSRSDQLLTLDVMIGWMRLFEMAYLQVEQGLLEPEALETLGYAGFLNSTILKATWPEVKPLVTSAFAEYVEASRQ